MNTYEQLEACIRATEGELNEAWIQYLDNKKEPDHGVNVSGMASMDPFRTLLVYLPLIKEDYIKQLIKVNQLQEEILNQNRY